jgi:hypothetical protein
MVSEGGRVATPLVVRSTISIEAPAEAVWDVLTGVRFLGEWDDLPDEYASDRLALGSELTWKRVDGGYTRLTVDAFEPLRRMRLALYGSTWPGPPSEYDVGYAYSLAEESGVTTLSLEIGDFAGIPFGLDHYDASLEFASRAARRIKALAEARDGAEP